MKQGLILVCCLVGIQSCSGKSTPKDCPLGVCTDPFRNLPCLGQATGKCVDGCYVVDQDCSPGTCIFVGSAFPFPQCTRANPVTVHFTAHGLNGPATVSLYSSLFGFPGLGDVVTLTVPGDGTYDLTGKYDNSVALVVTTRPAGQFCIVTQPSFTTPTGDIECSGTATGCDTAGVEDCLVMPGDPPVAQCPSVQQPDGGPSVFAFEFSPGACQRPDGDADAGRPICCHRQ
jgi:hypothetical protein